MNQMPKELQEFVDGLKSATEKFGLQEKTIMLLQQKVDDLSKEIVRLNACGLVQKEQGFQSVSEAKHFMDFVKGVMFGSVKDLVDTINVTNDTEGGYTVPLEFRNTLIRMIEVFGTIRQFATILPMQREEMAMPKLTSGLQVYWIGEGQTIPKKAPVFGEVKLTVKKMACLVPLTGEILEDSTIEMANLVAVLFAEAIAKEEDRVTLVGIGGGGGDAPWNGVLQDPSVTAMSMAAGKTSFTNVDADILADMIASMTAAQSSGARWFMHRTIFNVIRKLKDSTGNYIYSAPQGSDPATIWGYPLTLTDTMPGVGASAVAKPFLLLGNLKHVYIGDRKRMTIAQSQHLGFAEDKIFMRVIQREAMAIALPEALRVLKTAAA